MQPLHGEPRGDHPLWQLHFVKNHVGPTYKGHVWLAADQKTELENRSGAKLLELENQVRVFDPTSTTELKKLAAGGLPNRPKVTQP